MKELLLTLLFLVVWAIVLATLPAESATRTPTPATAQKPPRVQLPAGACPGASNNWDDCRNAQGLPSFWMECQ